MRRAAPLRHRIRARVTIADHAGARGASLHPDGCGMRMVQARTGWKPEDMPPRFSNTLR